MSRGLWLRLALSTGCALAKPPAPIPLLTLQRLRSEKKLVVYDGFDKVSQKNKITYLDMIKIFENNDVRRRGHVEFIYAALRHMQDFGVHKDLEVYKSLMEVLPKGRFVATNMFQAEYMHFPKQQQCAIDLLCQMEENGVMPDFEMEDILINTFGKRAFPLRKFWRMMYWMPKFKNLSPWRLPQIMPKDSLELAKLAIQRITSVDNNMKISVFRTEEIEASLDHTWIVSAQCPTQMTLLTKELDHLNKSPEEFEPLIVRGRYSVRLNEEMITYFTLTSQYRTINANNPINNDDVSNLPVPNIAGNASLPDLPPSVHEQDDGTILAVCATGTSSRDSLLSWIRLLEKHGNPSLATLPVIFTLSAPHSEVLLTEIQSANAS